MKKLLAVLLAFFLVCCSTPAVALNVSMNMTSGKYADYTVEGISFRLYGNESKTINTSEGRYTFYGNSMYHKGTKEAYQYLRPLFVSFDGGVSFDMVSALGPYITSRSPGSLLAPQAKTSTLAFRDYPIPAFALVRPASGHLAQIASKETKTGFADVMAGTVVLVVEKKGQYWKVETGEMIGWMAASSLVDYVPPDDEPAMVTLPAGSVFRFFSGGQEARYTSNRESIASCVGQEDGNYWIIGGSLVCLVAIPHE